MRGRTSSRKVKRKKSGVKNSRSSLRELEDQHDGGAGGDAAAAVTDSHQIVPLRKKSSGRLGRKKSKRFAELEALLEQEQEKNAVLQAHIETDQGQAQGQGGHGVTTTSPSHYG